MADKYLDDTGLKHLIGLIKGADSALREELLEAITGAGKPPDDVTIAVNGEGNLSVKDGGIGTDQLADSSVTTAKVADGAITADKLAEGGVGTAQLADGSVTAEKLAEGAVTADKLADGAITADKLSGLIHGGGSSTGELEDLTIRTYGFTNAASGWNTFTFPDRFEDVPQVVCSAEGELSVQIQQVSAEKFLYRLVTPDGSASGDAARIMCVAIEFGGDK